MPSDYREPETWFADTRLGANGDLFILCAAIAHIPANFVEVSLKKNFGIKYYFE